MTMTETERAILRELVAYANAETTAEQNQHAQAALDLLKGIQ